MKFHNILSKLLAILVNRFVEKAYVMYKVVVTGLHYEDLMDFHLPGDVSYPRSQENYLLRILSGKHTVGLKS
ncbi:hypothetical protein D3C72_2082150 [compost metagenome]